MGRYDGKTAVITGGTSGMGFATAKLLLKEGARVVVTGRTPKAIEAARAELGKGATVIASDTALAKDITGLAKQVKDAIGHVDLLFLNAGIGRFAPLEGVTEAMVDEVFAINTKGPLLTVQSLVSLLPSGSSVVLNTSIANEAGMPNMTVYAASKAALRSLARTLAAELLPKGIRVNAISPGPIETEIASKTGLPPEAVAQFMTHMKESNPMKRLGHVDEVARAVLFLAFDASFTTGAEFPVDGGASQL